MRRGGATRDEYLGNGAAPMRSRYSPISTAPAPTARKHSNESRPRFPGRTGHSKGRERPGLPICSRLKPRRTRRAVPMPRADRTPRYRGGIKAPGLTPGHSLNGRQEKPQESHYRDQPRRDEKRDRCPVITLLLNVHGETSRQNPACPRDLRRSAPSEGKNEKCRSAGRRRKVNPRRPSRGRDKCRTIGPGIRRVQNLSGFRYFRTEARVRVTRALISLTFCPPAPLRTSARNRRARQAARKCERGRPDRAGKLTWR
jgi:hypothetical protein